MKKIKSMPIFLRFLSCPIVILTVNIVFLALPSQAQNDIAPLVDHHQHLFSPTLAELISEPDNQFKSITAADLIPLLDEAEIERAVVLSTAYIFSQPGREVKKEYEKVKANNNWTSQQVASFPRRLTGFCSVNPLKEYALDEITRCANDPHLSTGLKLHFANAEVDYHDPQHIERLRKVFQKANEYEMALVVHMRASVSPELPYGRKEARIFLDELVPAAPDVPIQIGHLAGTGSYSHDPLVDSALSVFIEAIAQDDPQADRLWFDVTSVVNKDISEEQAAYLAKRIRQLGVERVVYGSDAAVQGNSPATGWATFRRLPLSEDEFHTIATNLVPYLE